MRLAPRITALALIALAITLIACRRHIPLPQGAIVFEGSGVALVPGDGWKQLRSGPFTAERNVCLPVLEGKDEFRGSVIQVYASGSDRSEPQKRAASLKKEIDLRPEVIKDSFKQEDFSAASGLRGTHVSYDLQIQTQARPIQARTHIYIVKNAARWAVGISYSTPAERDSEAIHQMIRNTLRLE